MSAAKPPSSRLPPTTSASPSPASRGTARPQSLTPRKSSSAVIRSSETPSNATATDRKRSIPKLPPKVSHEGPPARSQSRKPSLAPRASSNANESVAPESSKRKPPKLPPKQDKKGGSVQRPSAAASRRPSAAPKTSTQSVAKTNGGSKVEAGNPQSREQQQDLKSLLSDEQCQEIIQLVSGITTQMRRSVVDNFDAAATLTTLRQKASKGGDLENLDFDPGSVDVGAYDKEKKLRDEREKELSSPKFKNLKKASLQWFDTWREGLLKRVNETIKPEKATPAQQVKSEGKIESFNSETQLVHKFDSGGDYSPPKFEQLFPRVSTSLTKLPIPKRALILHSFLLLLLSLEHYTAASRVFLLYLASSLKLGLKYLREDEEKTARGLLEAAKQMTASKETLQKGKESEESLKWKMRLATVAGAAIVGLSGGYAAPMIAASVGAMMSELGLGASAAAGYLGTVAGNTYLVGSLFGAYGGRMTGEMMRNLSADVNDFAFLPVHGERKEHEDSIEAVTDYRRLRVIVAISGWLLEKEEVVTPWRVLSPSAEVFALRFELEALMKLGQSIDTMTANDAYGYAQAAFNNRAVITDISSILWPMALVKLARVVENPFSLARARAEKAGKILADALIKRTQGERPVTLIGYSIGARVIWSCLISLAERRAFGLVESAVLAGSPIASDISTWRMMRTAVSGRLVNVYSTSDYLLAFLYRTSSLQYGVAGLTPISGLSGVENVDVSESVSGHLRYRYVIGNVLQKIGFEDIDKNEVAKEADAFKAMVEAEKKDQKQHDYVRQAKEISSEIYEKYEKRSKSSAGKKTSIADADKEASAMEKEVQQKTQKGLMQWAVEQLYLTRPSVPSTSDAKDSISDPQGKGAETAKSANKTVDAATKSVYQRAKEAVYLSRSGGSKGQDTAKGRIAQAQNSTAPSASTSYLSTAAGYIPTGYLPSFGTASKTKKTASAKPPKTPDQATAATTDKRPSIGGHAPSEGKRPEVTRGTSEQAGKPGVKRAQSGIRKKSDSAANAKSDKVANKEGTEVASTREAKEQVADSTQGKPDNTSTSAKDVGNSQQDKEQKGDENAGKPAAANSGITSYLPSFGYGSSSKGDKVSEDTEAKSSSDDAKLTPPSTDVSERKTHSRYDSTEEAEKSAGETENEKAPLEESSGYSSYLPSFGYGKSSKGTETPRDAEAKTPPDDAKPTHTDTQPSRQEQDSHDEPAEDPKKQAGDTNNNQSKQEKASSYSSYFPSFGYGRSSAKGKEKAREDSPKPTEAKDDFHTPPSECKRDDSEEPQEGQNRTPHPGLEDPFVD